MILTPTKLIKFLGLRLGMSHSVVEITTEFMLKIAREVSLETFSDYFPLLKSVDLIIDRDQLEGRRGLYRIPPDLVSPNDIRVAIRVVTDSYLRSREQYMPYNYNPLDQQMVSDSISATTPVVTFKLNRPNILEVFPKNLYYKSLIVELGITHNKNFFTIKPTNVDFFKELVLIDVKHALYNIRKNYTNLSTVFGNIELELESISDMEAKRQEWIDTAKKDFYKSPERRRFFIG